MGNTKLSERDQAEVERSAEEAHAVVLPAEGKDQDQSGRYLNPPATTPYPLEYAFYLLGDIRGKTVLDLGCGSGENIIPLVKRGARVIGIDISPDLIALAQRRRRNAGVEADLKVGSAYDTGLEDGSVEVIFCIALVHHLDIKHVREEMLRVLAPGGVVILKEPIRFSRTYGFLRGLLPAQRNVSEFEHPLTREEMAAMTECFDVQEARYFRLPWIPLVARVLPFASPVVWRADSWMLRHCPRAKHYSTGAVMRLVRTDN